MDLGRLGESPIGSLVEIRGNDPEFGDYDTYAFLPTPLPDTLVLDTSTWSAVTKASEALGALRQACKQLPNPRILVAPSLAIEAVSSSMLEGTHSTMESLLEARLSNEDGRTPETREVRAFDRVAHAAFDQVHTRPVSVQFLAELQGELAQNSVRPSRDPGKLRTHQVYIGQKYGPIGSARFVPPPPGDQLRAALEDWVTWLEAPSELPVVVRAVMAHYQFETIHPFADGNGRIGRLVFILQLLKGGCLDEGALSISPWLVTRREQYQDHLFEMSCTGLWDPLVHFFCEAIIDQAERHIGAADRLRLWLSAIQRELSTRHWSGTIAEVAEALIEWPVITAPQIQRSFGITAPPSYHIIDRLVEIGALEQIQGTWPKTYRAPGVMTIVEDVVGEEHWV